MIVYKEGSIFNTTCQTIVNPVNCVGVMGKGLALTFKVICPKMFELYQDYCKKGLLGQGKLWIYDGSTKWRILNFPTKNNWRDWTEEYWLTMGLKKFIDTYQEKGITSIAFPILGAGNGRMNEEKSLEIMRRFLNAIPITIEIWKYDGTDAIWDEVWNAAKDEDTILKRIIRDCNSFEDLVSRNGVGKNTIRKIQSELGLDYEFK